MCVCMCCVHGYAHTLCKEGGEEVYEIFVGIKFPWQVRSTSQNQYQLQIYKTIPDTQQ